MTTQELKQILYTLAKSYFAGADVVWAMQGQVSPTNPVVLLTMLPVVRKPRPIRRNVNGVVVDAYPSKTTLQVDLYTQGAAPEQAPGIKQRYENTAVNDINSFVNFLGSVAIDHFCQINDISIEAGAVQDLTQLDNGISWEFRAMVELAVGFTGHAVGHTGTNFEDGVEFNKEGNPVGVRPYVPNPSGGGSQQLADEKTGWFEDAELVSEGTKSVPSARIKKEDENVK